MATTTSSKAITSSNVLLFVPNLIGYSRIILMLLAFAFAKTNWQWSMACYLGAFTGDLFDGMAARYFNQCSEFGGILDMVTDRVSTAGLLMILAQLYPDYHFFFNALMCIDIFSHWFHVMSTAGDGHHKSDATLEHRNIVLRCYYAVPFLFAYCCVGAELFYVLLYVMHFNPHPLLHQICFYGCLPGCAIKQVVNVAQLFSAADVLAARDAAIINKKK
mmetsp:Transcript_36930/g.68675  ORF Transcript_36930/g.68675 Transcript_36930/m.68675 type:complete len:218 (-) Transcript_36930:1126-1779(-)